MDADAELLASSAPSPVRAGLTRRTLLACGAALCGRALTACGEDVTTLDAGPASALAVGTLRALSGPAAIGRDAGGIYALSTLCTHAQCDMTQQGSIGNSGLSCSCHGSQFSATGSVVRGPANLPLRHLQVVADGAGNLTVDATVTVASSTRLQI